MDINITDGTEKTVETYTLTERDMIEAGSPQFLDVISTWALHRRCIPFTCAPCDSSAGFADLVFH